MFGAPSKTFRNTSAAVAGCALATGLVTAAAPSAAAAPAPSAAAARTQSPLWCGRWLRNPGSGDHLVPGTRMRINREMYTQVNDKKVNRVWYAWAKLYHSGVSGSGVALIWRNKSNKVLYQCGGRNGRDAFQRTGCSNTPCNAYSAAVDDPHAIRVQAKVTGGYGDHEILYGPVQKY
ncbi:hypothetical protein [Actinomadura macrotermitis]|uniref:Uncharacterized protein n=1 Tax=Actinomadura macrotermitis TaxID=2585200 RepID=A0A7K0BW84_9ACTN|nr:hypothetical protein [Actinomadura macrotermitis]MQY05443.1 hypothetical protein [Actinomadura macrotermitis]